MKRRTGRTTRQVDVAIQELFNTGSVFVVDHAANDNNMADSNLKRILMNRMYAEHGIELNVKRAGKIGMTFSIPDFEELYHIKNKSNDIPRTTEDTR